ncbi:MAG: hypothetical protein K6A81_11710 [Clostridiales bacterium]|nr:hypothetical protein [Clostridiales bacterium]
MRKYQTILCISYITCVLLSLSGCSMLKKSKTYMVYSDSNRNVSFVEGSYHARMGIVLDEREFFECDYEGNELVRMVFDTDIVSLDMLYHYSLLGFEDNHVEKYYVTEKECILETEYSFQSSIKKTELTNTQSGSSEYGVAVLLENGEFWVSDKNGDIVLIEQNVKDFDYSISSDVILYAKDSGELCCVSSRYTLDAEVMSLTNVSTIESAFFLSLRDENIRFRLMKENESLFIEVDKEHNRLSLCDLQPDIKPDMIFASKTIPEAVIYEADGFFYYEGPSYNQRHSYGDKYRGRVKLSIPEGYNIHTIMGGVIFYNDHEVKVLLIN